MKLNKPLVSVAWLKTNLEASNLVILNASIPKVSEKTAMASDESLIPYTRFFDIKNKFSDTSASFPNTFPSEAQFTREAQLLGIDCDSCIVIYDDKGIYSSARAWWLFKAFGHDNVAVLDGGLPEWNKLNCATENYQPFQGKSGDFVGVENKKLMKFFEDVKLETQNASHIIMDARSEERFNCLVDEPREGLRRGRIPNSVNLPFENVLDGHCLKKEDDLKRLFSKFANTNDHITFSCGSGITACVLALGAQLAGYKYLSVYDGSWTEWGSLTSS
ncbi:MAG: sulfurtransferase [Gelidibacter sp.]|nr:sulfurtransferase [Gelidibacter sp.]